MPIPSIPSINIHDAIFEEPKPLEFIFEGFKARTVGFLTAPGSTGKGFFSLQLAMSLADTSKSINFLNLCNYKRGKIGFLSAEDEADILTNRIHDIGQYYGQKTKFKTEMFKAISENLDIKSLRGLGANIFGTNEIYTEAHNQEWVEYIKVFSKDKKLVIIDTLNKFHATDENSNGLMGAFVEIFEKITVETGTSFLIIHHSNKNASNSGTLAEASSSRGASAIIDNSRYQLTLNTLTAEEAKTYDLDDDERKFFVKVNFAKINYTKPMASKLLQRQTGGVLAPATLEKETKKGDYGRQKN